MSWNANNLPTLPTTQSGMPDALAAANTAYDGMFTTLQTVQAANEVAQMRSLDAPIRALASSIVGNLDNAASDVPERIAKWVRENVKYTQETPMIEVLQGPYRTLGDNVRVQTPMGPYQFRGTGTGDCDDLSILFACLCRSVGIEAFLAGIAQPAKPESFYHAMGYCNGVFYELSKDAPYGGLGGRVIASPAPYPNMVATIYDPARRSYTRLKPKPEANMSGSNCDDHCTECQPCKERNLYRETSMGLSEGFGGALRPPTQALLPFVDSLQPRYSVPLNLYAPTRQISGISMNGSMGIGAALTGGSINSSPLLTNNLNTNLSNETGGYTGAKRATGGATVSTSSGAFVGGLVGQPQLNIKFTPKATNTTMTPSKVHRVGPLFTVPDLQNIVRNPPIIIGPTPEIKIDPRDIIFNPGDITITPPVVPTEETPPAEEKPPQTSSGIGIGGIALAAVAIYLLTRD